MISQSVSLSICVSPELNLPVFERRYSQRCHSIKCITPIRNSSIDLVERQVPNLIPNEWPKRMCLSSLERKMRSHKIQSPKGPICTCSKRSSDSVVLQDPSFPSVTNSSTRMNRWLNTAFVCQVLTSQTVLNCSILEVYQRSDYHSKSFKWVSFLQRWPRSVFCLLLREKTLTCYSKRVGSNLVEFQWYCSLPSHWAIRISDQKRTVFILTYIVSSLCKAGHSRRVPVMLLLLKMLKSSDQY